MGESRKSGCPRQLVLRPGVTRFFPCSVTLKETQVSLGRKEGGRKGEMEKVKENEGKRGRKTKKERKLCMISV